MTKIQLKTKEIYDMLLPIIGEIRSKTYFSYYGLFKNDVMFALYKEDHLYLKVAPEDIDVALALGATQLQEQRINSSFHYYDIPYNQLAEERLKQLIEKSIEAIKLNKFVSYYAQKGKIRNLPNMNFYYECMLRRINILTPEDLYQKGAIQTFVELVKNNEQVNHISLYRLYGAINHQFFHTIPNKVCIALVMEANEALEKVGLKPMFNI